MEPNKHPHCWASPDDALEDIDSFTSFGEVNKPFPTTACLSVWGRGRPRPKITEIVLPAEKKAVTVNVCPSKSSFQGRGRGRLLLLEEEEVQDTSNIGKQQLKSTKNISLHDIEETYGQKKLNNSTTQPTTTKLTLEELKQHLSKETTFESNNLFSPNDFPELQ